MALELRAKCKRFLIAAILVMAMMLGYGGQALAGGDDVGGDGIDLSQYKATSGVMHYVYEKESRYLFIAGHTGQYRIQDPNRASIVEIVDTAGNHVGSFNCCDVVNGTYPRTAYVYLRKGEKYLIHMYSPMTIVAGMGQARYEMSGDVYLAFADACKKGVEFAIGGVTYQVLSADKRTDDYSVKILRAKNVKKFKKGEVRYKGLWFDIKQVAKNAFKGNKRLTEVEIVNDDFLDGEMMVSVGPKAFADCPKLKLVSLSTKTIGAYAFKGCKKLCCVELRGTENIGKCAFTGDKKLSYIEFMSLSSPKTIKKAGFKNCLKGSMVEEIVISQRGGDTDKAVRKLKKAFAKGNSGRKVFFM